MNSISSDLEIPARRHDAPSSAQRITVHFLKNNARNEVTRFLEIVLAIKFSPALDLRRLERAFLETVTLHPELASTFHVSDKGKEIRVKRIGAEHFQIGAHDCSQMDEKSSQALMNSRADTEFDVQNGPLATLDAFTFNDGSMAIMLRLSHVVVDGWSTEIVVRTLIECYFGPAEIPRKPAAATFEDFVDWEEEFETGPASAAHLMFWKRQMADFDARIPYRIATPANADADARSGKCSLVIDEETTARLRHSAHSCGASIFTFLLAAYALALAEMTGTLLLPIRSNAANRIRPGFHSIVGDLANSNCLRIDIDISWNFRHLLHHVADQLQAVMEHQNSFWWALETLGPQIPTFSGSVFDQFGFQKWSAQSEDDSSISKLLYDPDAGAVKIGGLEISPVRLPALYPCSGCRCPIKAKTLLWQHAATTFLPFRNGVARIYISAIGKTASPAGASLRSP